MQLQFFLVMETFKSYSLSNFQVYKYSDAGSWVTNWTPKVPEWWHDTIKHGAEEDLLQEPPIGWTDEKVEKDLT